MHLLRGTGFLETSEESPGAQPSTPRPPTMRWETPSHSQAPTALWPFGAPGAHVRVTLSPGAESWPRLVSKARGHWHSLGSWGQSQGRSGSGATEGVRIHRPEEERIFRGEIITEPLRRPTFLKIQATREQTGTGWQTFSSREGCCSPSPPPAPHPTGNSSIQPRCLV